MGLRGGGGGLTVKFLSVCLLDLSGCIICNKINQFSISGPGTRGQTRCVRSTSRLQLSQTQETQGLSLEHFLSTF